jgi:hypothetical protein
MNNPNTVGFNIDEIRKLAEALAASAQKTTLETLKSWPSQTEDGLRMNEDTTLSLQQQSLSEVAVERVMSAVPAEVVSRKSELQFVAEAGVLIEKWRQEELGLAA